MDFNFQTFRLFKGLIYCMNFVYKFLKSFLLIRHRKFLFFYTLKREKHKDFVQKGTSWIQLNCPTFTDSIAINSAKNLLFRFLLIWYKTNQSPMLKHIYIILILYIFLRIKKNECFYWSSIQIQNYKYKKKLNP